MSILAQSDVPASTNTQVLALLVDSTVNVLITNRTGAAIHVSLGLVPSGGTLGNASWIEYQLPLDGNQPLERDGMPLKAGDAIWVLTDAAGVSCTVLGLPI